MRLTGTAEQSLGHRSRKSAAPQAAVAVRTVSGSVGYGSSSDLTVHFGLGAAIRASIEIRWPSGRTQSVGEVAADQRLALTEPGD